jgi:TM2 domain-containing membrane protein YozV
MTEPVCPYCRMPFDAANPPRIFCTACGTPHHEDCYQENGGCTVFGCARAPADDPKLQVSQSDLSAVHLPGQPYAPQAQPHAAAARASVPQYPPSIYGGPLGLSSAAAQSAASPASPYPYAQPPLPAYPLAALGRSQKSRTTYIVLGIFLGALGIHNFYAGYTGRAVGQLCLSVLTLLSLAVFAWIWAIVEICIVTKDSAGLDFS